MSWDGPDEAIKNASLQFVALYLCRLKLPEKGENKLNKMVWEPFRSLGALLGVTDTALAAALGVPGAVAVRDLLCLTKSAGNGIIPWLVQEPWGLYDAPTTGLDIKH